MNDIQFKITAKADQSQGYGAEAEFALLGERFWVRGGGYPMLAVVRAGVRWFICGELGYMWCWTGRGDEQTRQPLDTSAAKEAGRRIDDIIARLDRLTLSPEQTDNSPYLVTI
jgi:hypothetical protein